MQTLGGKSRVFFSAASQLFLLLAVTLLNTAPSSALQLDANGQDARESHYELVVIGAGSGGLACARRAAGYGVKVAVVENSLVGGTCVNYGCMPKKVMWLAADAGETYKALPYYGFLPCSSDARGAHAARGCPAIRAAAGGAAAGGGRGEQAAAAEQGPEPAPACLWDAEREAAARGEEGKVFASASAESEAGSKEEEETRHRRGGEGGRGMCFCWSELRTHRLMYVSRLRSIFQQALKDEGIPFYGATASFLPVGPAAAVAAAGGTPQHPTAEQSAAKGGHGAAAAAAAGVSASGAVTRGPAGESAEAAANTKRAGEEEQEGARDKKLSSDSTTPHYKLLLTFTDGSTKIISAEHVVVATGARRLRATHIRGTEFTSTTDELLLMEEPPKKVAILGSSFSATEFSSILAALGVEVHLFFRAPRLLARSFDEDAVRALEVEMQRSRVQFHRSVRVTEVALSDSSGNPAPATYTFSSSPPSSLSSPASPAPSSASSSPCPSPTSSPPAAFTLPTEQQQQAAASRGGGQQLQQQQQNTGNKRPLLTVYLTNGEAHSGFDVVVSALGIAPAVESLQLQNVGVEMEAPPGQTGYIRVDKYQNTTAARIYAVGDVTGKGMVASSAVAAGRLLADRVFGGVPEAFVDLSTKSNVVFSYPPLAAVGMTEDAAVKKYGKENIQLYTSTFISTFYAPWTINRSDKRRSFIKLVCLKNEEDKIVGLHVMGRHAEELLQGFAVAVHLGARKSDLDSTLAIHPTSAEEVVTLKPWRKSPAPEAN